MSRGTPTHGTATKPRPCWPCSCSMKPRKSCWPTTVCGPHLRPCCPTLVCRPSPRWAQRAVQPDSSYPDRLLSSPRAALPTAQPDAAGSHLPGLPMAQHEAAHSPRGPLKHTKTCTLLSQLPVSVWALSHPRSWTTAWASPRLGPPASPAPTLWPKIPQSLPLSTDTGWGSVRRTLL